MYPNTDCHHDCYRPGDCDGSCTHPELTEPISDAGHTVADGLRHEIETIRYEVRRLREVRANQPDWEKLWAEVSEENDRLRTLLTERDGCLNTADAYEIAAQWHDKNARLCQDVADDEPRIGAEVRTRAADAAKHHAASAAGLRLAAIEQRRRRLLSPA